MHFRECSIGGVFSSFFLFLRVHIRFSKLFMETHGRSKFVTSFRALPPRLSCSPGGFNVETNSNLKLYRNIDIKKKQDSLKRSSYPEMFVVMICFQQLLNLRKVFHFRHNSFHRQLLQDFCVVGRYESCTKLTIYSNIISSSSIGF